MDALIYEVMASIFLTSVTFARLLNYLISLDPIKIRILVEKEQTVRFQSTYDILGSHKDVFDEPSLLRRDSVSTGKNRRFGRS